MIFPVSDCHKKENTSFLHKKHWEISYGKRNHYSKNVYYFGTIRIHILLKREYILNC